MSAVRKICSHCHGSGYAPDDVVDDQLHRLIREQAERFLADCAAHGVKVWPGDLVDTKAAAWLLMQEPPTLKQWRSEEEGPSYEQHGRRVLYRISALAEFKIKRRREVSRGMAR